LNHKEKPVSPLKISYNFDGRQTMEKNRSDIVFRQFNTTIDWWISWLHHYTFEALCRQPEKGQWSLGQVYTHIIADTNYFIEQMKAAIADDVNSEKEMHADAKAMFARDAFPDMQLSNPFPESVKQPRTKEGLQQGLLKIKAEVGRLFKLYDFSAFAGKSLHPGLLFFSALEWLQFADMHMRHHFMQKKKIDSVLSEAGKA